MEIKNYDNSIVNTRMYGGMSGSKLGIIDNGENYLLKYAGNLKEKNLKNVELSYSNSPVSEYIGSHIYEMIGVPVHETFLGYRNNRILVACKDFRPDNAVHYMFSEIKTTMEPEFINSHGSASDGTSGNLDEIIETMEKHHILKDLPGVKERFWDMFVVDALIGNNDRNNGNWGILVYKDHIELTPVYDNGNCLNNKWNDSQMEKVLTDNEELKKEAYNGRLCFHSINGKKINPYHYIMKMENNDCNMAVERIVPKIDLDKINDIIEDVHSVGIISDTAARFYRTIMYERYTKVLEPTYNKIKEMQIDNEIEKQHIKRNTR